MNKFVLGRPFGKIKRDKKIYVVVMMQLIIAFGIINIFLSLLFDIYENKKQLTETDVKYQIEIQDHNFDYLKFDLIAWGEAPIEMNEYGSFPFSSTIEQINSHCQNCELGVDVTIELVYLGDLLNQGEKLLVCYSSGDTKVRCSKRAEEILADVSDQNTINAKDFPHTINGNILTTLEGKEYEIEYSEDDELTIYMPLEIYYNLYHPKDLRGTVLSVKENSQKSVSSDELNIIVSQLREMYSDEYQFDIKSELARYLEQTEEAEKEAKVLIFISSVIFVIVLIGMIGIFIMLVNRRKKEIAICCALGQTKDQIIFEMFAEISVLNVSAYSVGLLISCLIMQNGISVATIVFTYHNWSGIILFAVSMILAGIAMIPVRHLVKKMSPIAILSSL